MVIGPGAADDSVTVRVTRLVPALPSLIETLLLEADGGAGSSLTIVTVPGAPAVALVAFDSCTVDVSLGSNVVSPTMLGGIVIVMVPPGMNVTVPEAAT